MNNLTEVVKEIAYALAVAESLSCSAPGVDGAVLELREVSLDTTLASNKGVVRS